jgi:hypothetical protein
MAPTRQEVIDTRCRAIESHRVHLAPSLRILLGFVLAAAAGSAGCNRNADCVAEISDAKATYKGASHGQKGQPQLDRDAVRDACRQMCAANKAEMPDACATGCLADADGGKLSARTNCTDR